MCHTSLSGMLAQRWKKKWKYPQARIALSSSGWTLSQGSTLVTGIQIKQGAMLEKKKRSKILLFLSPLYSFNALQRLPCSAVRRKGCGCRCSLWEISPRSPKSKWWTEVEIETSTVLKFPCMLVQAVVSYPGLSKDLTLHMHCISSLNVQQERAHSLWNMRDKCLQTRVIKSPKSLHRPGSQLMVWPYPYPSQ